MSERLEPSSSATPPGSRRGAAGEGEPTAATRYVSGEYYRRHTSFHAQDSAWKAREVHETLRLAGERVRPGSVAEVGCGAGGVVARLRELLPDATFAGFDISPHAIGAARARHPEIRFEVVGETGVPEGWHSDLLLAIDVVEHVENPVGFLRGLRPHCRYLIAHIPLAISVMNALRPHTLTQSRWKVGHLHYFTEELAEETFKDAGYTIVQSRITPSGIANRKGTRAWLARLPRALAFAISPSRAAHLLGGFSIMILAESASGATSAPSASPGGRAPAHRGSAPERQG